MRRGNIFVSQRFAMLKTLIINFFDEKKKGYPHNGETGYQNCPWRFTSESFLLFFLPPFFIRAHDMYTRVFG